MMKSTIFIAFLINTVVSRHHKHHKSHISHLVNVFKPHENSFSQTNKNIQIIMNTLFETFNLAEQFVHQPKTKLLLTMLYDLNNIAGNNFDLYDVLRNVTDVELNDTSLVLHKIRLDEALNEMVNENALKHNSNEKQTIKSTNDNPTVRATMRAEKHTKQGERMSGFKDSSEFKEFITRFLLKVNRLTVDDLFTNRSREISLLTRRNSKPSEQDPIFLNNRRIYDGKSMSIKDFPFLASIHIQQEFMGAGNIIKNDLVLTAASCVQIHYNNRFFRENPKNTYIRIGSDYASQRGELLGVLEIYFYPTYDPRTLRNNIAILRLTRHINKHHTHNKCVTASLDSFNGNLATNTEEVIVVGWGSKSISNIVSTLTKLQASHLEFYPVDDCRKLYSSEFVTENNFCAGFLSKAGGACNRDVGGPGIVDGRLVGIVSFGPPMCGALNAPTVFTRVGNYINWIEGIMAERAPSYGKPTTTERTSMSLVHYYNMVMEKRPTFKVKPVINKTNYYIYSTIGIKLRSLPEEEILKEIILDLDEQKGDDMHNILREAFVDDYDSVDEQYKLQTSSKSSFVTTKDDVNKREETPSTMLHRITRDFNKQDSTSHRFPPKEHIPRSVIKNNWARDNSKESQDKSREFNYNLKFSSLVSSTPKTTEELLYILRR